MSDHFEVDTEALREHAKTVDGFVDRLQQAVGAARQVSVPETAFGQICQFLPPMLNPVEERGVQALQAGSEGMDTTAANLRSSADRYVTADDRNAFAMENITHQLDGEAR